MDLTWDPIKLAESSKTFCVLPWSHQYVHMDGAVRGCCIHRADYGSLKKDSLEDIWNSKATREIRMQMLNGEKPKGCEACTNIASLASKTLASISNDWLFTITEDDDQNSFKYKVRELVASTDDTGYVKEHKLFYMDNRFNNLCNYSCHPCGPTFSTSWINDHINFVRVYPEMYSKNTPTTFNYAGKTESDLLEQIIPKLKDVQRVYFAGGEPMMQEDHYKVLEELIRIGRTDVKIRYNTNMSRLKLGNWDLIEMWKKFDNVDVSASLDAIGKQAEYWRYGTKWDQIVKNVKTIKKETPHVTISITSSIGWPNVYSAMELHKTWVETNLIDINDFGVNFINSPESFSLRNINRSKKIRILQDVEKHIEWCRENGGTRIAEEFADLINLMMQAALFTTDILKNQFHTKTVLIDVMRGQNFWETFPEHADMRSFLEKTYGSDTL